MIAEFITVQGPLGLEVRISSSWIVVAVFLMWSLSTVYFPIEVPVITETSSFVLSVVATVGVFVSMLFHEMALIIVAGRNGLPPL